MVTTKVLLLACGSFNPPTLLHLRMFEVARDTLRKQGLQVVGGVVSPVHDGYGKQDLAKGEDRLELLQLSTSDSDWIRVSDWEVNQSEWQCTVKVLQHHQNVLNMIPNEALNGNEVSPVKNGPKKLKKSDSESVPNWLTSSAITAALESDVRVMLLCGGDMFESFIKPNLWKTEDLEEIIGKFGVVVMHRDGCDPHSVIYESDFLNKFQSNIIVAKEWIANTVSSTKIRRAVRRGDSIKYLVPDRALKMIQQLYSSNNKYEYTSIFPTPSPNDVHMDSNSPTTNFMNEINNLKVPSSHKRPPNLMIEKCAFPGQAVKVQGQPGALLHNLPEKQQALASGDEGEKETKVEIQITKDGIKVISDKETTV